jgi:outer membrane receptor protein involved in Fe transport
MKNLRPRAPACAAPAAAAPAVLAAALALAALAVSAAALAQQAPPAPPPDDEVVQMSAFEVADKPDRGYIADESLTGTRVPTAIRDLSFVVNTITSEFMEDFGMLEINENMGYTSTLNGLDQGGGYNLRGFSASTMLRNGFMRLGMVDRVNVDRVEILKGPNAVMYGQTQPSGLINVVTRRPRKKPGQRATLTFGSLDQWREEFTSTGPVPGAGRTYYRLAAALYDRRFEYATYSAMHTKTASLVVSHDFDSLGTITAEIEYMDRKNRVPNKEVPYLYHAPNTDAHPNWSTSNMTAERYANPNAGRYYIGIADFLRDYEPNGPDSRNDRDITTLTLSHEKSYNRVFSTRVSANAFTRNLVNFNNTTVSYYITSGTNAGLIQRSTPSLGTIDEDGVAAQADLLAHYWLARGKIENKTMLTFDYNSIWRHDPTVTLADFSGSNTFLLDGAPYYVRLQNPAAPDYRIPAHGATAPDGRLFYDSGDHATLNRWNKDRVEVMGTLLRHQTSLFAGRIIGYAGVRLDWVKSRLRENDRNTAVILNGVTTAREFSYRYRTTATSPMLGVNLKVAPPLAVYANWSRSFDPRAGSIHASDVESNGGKPWENETAEGWDYGVKCGFLDDTLSFTLGGFYIDRRNVRVADIDDHGDLFYFAGGDQLARGVEFDGTWRATKNLTLLAGCGHVKSQQKNVGRDIDALGRPPKNLPKSTLYTAIKYSFGAGPLKGLSFNLGVRYTGRMATANPTDGALVEPATIGGIANPNAGLILRNSGQRDIYTPGYTLVDAGIRYAFKKRKTSHTIGLNLSNTLDEEYYAASRKNGEGRGAVVSYSIKH